eukprot:3543151-Amphidinium_carterae.1
METKSSPGSWPLLKFLRNLGPSKGPKDTHSFSNLSQLFEPIQSACRLADRKPTPGRLVQVSKSRCGDVFGRTSQSQTYTFAITESLLVLTFLETAKSSALKRDCRSQRKPDILTGVQPTATN